MKTRTLRIVLIVTSFLIAGNGAFAGTAAAPRHSSGSQTNSVLGLTPEQRAQVHAIGEKFRADNAGLVAEIRELHDKLNGYMRAHDKANAKLTRGQIEAKIKELDARRKEMLAKSRAVLNPVQYKVLCTNENLMQKLH